MKTKEKILDAAKRLFNTQGFTQVGMRAIAKESGISLGNLTYHFKLKDDIVWALYLEFSMQVSVQLKVDENAFMASVIESLRCYYQGLFEYRFFMLELNYFMKHFENIFTHYVSLEKDRKKQITNLLYRLRNYGLMFYETVEGYDKLLINQWFLHSNFWMAQQAIHQPQLTEKVVEKGVEDLFLLLLPQMTLIGKKRFKAALKDLSNQSSLMAFQP